MNPIDAKHFGCVGDGSADDTAALFDLFCTAQQQRRAIEFPFGQYVSKAPIRLHCNQPMVVRGDGQGASKLVFDGCAGLSFTFDQHGIQQPVGLNMRDLSIAARGACGTGLRVSYNNSGITNDHFRAGSKIRDVGVESSDQGHWSGGVVLDHCWNASLEHVYVSGNPCGGAWNNMAGAGIALEGMCVNTHISNCRSNFWATGLYAHGIKANHEGIFCSNNSMVAVKRGVWLSGNTANQAAPRVSTLTWTGGLIELRVGGVVGGSAAFHLQNVWDVMIGQCHMLAETLDTLESTYGIVPQDCMGVVATGNRFNALTDGFFTTGPSSGHVVSDNCFTHVLRPVKLNPGCLSSVAKGNTRHDGVPVSDVSV